MILKVLMLAQVSNPLISILLHPFTILPFRQPIRHSPVCRVLPVKARLFPDPIVSRKVSSFGAVLLEWPSEVSRSIEWIEFLSWKLHSVPYHSNSPHDKHTHTHAYTLIHSPSFIHSLAGTSIIPNLCMHAPTTLQQQKDNTTLTNKALCVYSQREVVWKMWIKPAVVYE